MSATKGEKKTDLKEIYEEVKDNKLTPAEEEKILKRPRTLFQKFLFVIITCLQAVIVYMIQYDIDFGISALRPNAGGKILFHYSLLIYGSFLLTFISFISSCILTPGTEFYSNFVLAIDASSATVSSALVNAIGSDSLGATGDIITILKSLIQYQILICYINVGFGFVFNQPHIKIPDFVQIYFDTLDKIDEYFNALLIPVISALDTILWVITIPFIRVAEWIYHGLAYLLNPLRYFFAWIIFSFGWATHKVADFFHFIWTHVVHAVSAALNAVKDAFDWIIATAIWLWESYVVFPAFWFWENIIVRPSLWLAERFEFIGVIFEHISKLFKMCYNYFYRVDESVKIHDSYGWIEKQGHFRRNWTNRFYTLKRGTFSYFTKMGDAYPPVGADIKGSLDLMGYKYAYVEDRAERLVSLICDLESGKNYTFRAPSVTAAEELVIALNAQIKFAKGHEDIQYH